MVKETLQETIREKVQAEVRFHMYRFELLLANLLHLFAASTTDT